MLNGIVFVTGILITSYLLKLAFSSDSNIVKIKDSKLFKALVVGIINTIVLYVFTMKSGAGFTYFVTILSFIPTVIIFIVLAKRSSDAENKLSEETRDNFVNIITKLDLVIIEINREISRLNTNEINRTTEESKTQTSDTSNTIRNLIAEANVITNEITNIAGKYVTGEFRKTVMLDLQNIQNRKGVTIESNS
jgi:hypothetical protein